MPNKKKQKNSFYFFMKEMQEDYAKRGTNLSMSELPAIAHPKWKSMSLAEREVYERKAKGYKIQLTSGSSKLASDGTSIQQNLELMEEEEQRGRQVILDIRGFVNSGDCDPDQFIEFAPHNVFYVMAFNICCCTEENVYIPLEVGIMEYSIQKGIIRDYHKFIYPGPIPTGYMGESKRHSEESHQIPVCGHEDSERNYGTVLQEIKSFINPKSVINPAVKDVLPPLFCLQDDLDQTAGCLRWLSDRAMLSEDDDFKVWSLVYLMMELSAGAGKAMPSAIIASELLKKNTFDFTIKTRCEYHEELDIAHCALGCARRLCFLLSDYLCGVFDVEVTEKHLPCRAQEDKPYEIYHPNIASTREIPEAIVPRGIGRGFATTASGRNNSYNERNQFDGRGFRKDFDAATQQESGTPSHKHPKSTSLTSDLSQLKLTAAAIVPGKGIGRGKPQNM